MFPMTLNQFFQDSPCQSILVKLWFFITAFKCIPKGQMAVSDKINTKKACYLTTQRESFHFLKDTLQQLGRITFNINLF